MVRAHAAFRCNLVAFERWAGAGVRCSGQIAGCVSLRRTCQFEGHAESVPPSSQSQKGLWLGRTEVRGVEGRNGSRQGGFRGWASWGAESEAAHRDHAPVPLARRGA